MASIFVNHKGLSKTFIVLLTLLRKISPTLVPEIRIIVHEFLPEMNCFVANFLILFTLAIKYRLMTQATINMDSEKEIAPCVQTLDIPSFSPPSTKRRAPTRKTVIRPRVTTVNSVQIRRSDYIKEYGECERYC